MGITRRDRTWLVLTALFTLGILAAIWMLATPAPPPRPLATAYYVWQMQWNDDVRDAVRLAEPSANALMVQVGAINAAKKDLGFSEAFPDWKALAQGKAPITAVLRANAGLADFLQGGDTAGTLAYVTGTIDTVLAEGASNGLTVRGIQLDYDCPTAKLATYRTLVDTLRARYPKHELSLTALPTWLKWNDFAALVKALDYYVLQVHSLEPPTQLGNPIVLCDTTRIPGYLRRAASIGVPYYVALPTYGYRVVYDSKGKFAALIAEGPATALRPGYQVRTAMADAGAIAEVVRTIVNRPPNGLLGVAWFRLPIASDDLNWSWPALQAVRQGRAPVLAFAAELRSPSPGLQEVWIKNTGEMDATSNVHVALQYPVGVVVASDTHNGFAAEAISTRAGVTLTGPAPRPQKEVLAAWFRLRESGTVSADQNVLRLGSVLLD